MKSHDATPLSDLGVTKTDSSRWQTIASIPESDFDAHLAPADRPHRLGALRGRALPIAVIAADHSPASASIGQYRVGVVVHGARSGRRATIAQHRDCGVVTLGPVPDETPPPEPEPQSQSQIIMDPSQMAGVWANFARVGQSPYEFTLDFIRLDFGNNPPNGIVVARVSMSPLFVTQLIEALEGQWQQYADRAMPEEVKGVGPNSDDAGRKKPTLSG